ncbi:helix-turn-helix domain-containing protein [Streptomyces sp. NPDC101234]|uniref:helix-turn-helix domain-containing protein n=1 Tax=Streptomyces sp. NPDC101234 TaxID=3366138 RepID=UPI00381EF66D
MRELSALNELLRQHAAIHDRFIGVARRGGGVTDIATELAEITDRRATDLVTTLRTYLDHDLNTNATAEALYIHPNTVGLRVRRIESLLGVRLTSVGDLTTLRAALAIDDITRDA